jgi:peptidoglycan lytic transglycosylase
MNESINFHFASNAGNIMGMIIKDHCSTLRAISVVTCALALSIAVTGSSIATPLGPLRARAVEPVPADADAAPLSRGDVARYRQIFAYQDAGQWQGADALIAQLHDPLLLGHVQQQRYMHPDAYRSSFAELSAWLEAYGDLPGADRVYRLARTRRPQGAAAPTVPVGGYLGGSGQERQEVNQVAYRSRRERSKPEQMLVDAWRQGIDKLVRNRQPEAASLQLKARNVVRLLDRTELDLARWQVAQGYLAVGDPLAALKLARWAAVGSGDTVPEIHWTAGISAWRHGLTALAMRHFTALAHAEEAHASERARAAFWAARASVIAQRPQDVGQFLRIAAEDGQSFYGLLARTALGEEQPQEGATDVRPDAALPALAEAKGVRRALALIQVGRRDLAERELRKLAGRADPELKAGLMALAARLDLPAVQMRLAQSLRHREDFAHHDALYPLPNWQPADGFILDRALLYAVIRAESGFDPAAESHAGARGLMQVMPATAREVAARAEIELTDGKLFEPVTGIMLGQAYLDQILQLPGIDGNLMLLAVAYNAGPGRVKAWREALALDDDPLLFLESIPLPETRIYVKKVLTNLWNYRARLGQPRPSLKALTGNHWPLYQALDTKPSMHAWN